LRGRVEDPSDAEPQATGSFHLPEVHGGRLELAASIVRETIDANVAAGQPVYHAESEYPKAREAEGFGDYKEAYRRCAPAYKEAVK
jgi:hypothetical protein